MGLSGGVTTILYILQYFNKRKNSKDNGKIVNTNKTVIMSDNLE